MKRSFDLKAALPEAWALIWKAKAKEQLENAQAKHVYRPERATYITASDMENQVRQFAIDDVEGKPRGKIAWGAPSHWPVVRISTGGRGSLLGVCRDWLLDECRSGRIHSHNFGRGHISGMRFRPAGQPLSEPEKATIKRMAKPKTRLFHLRKGGGCACVKRTGFSFRPTKSWTTSNPQRVTCPRCVKIIEGGGQ
jgi:hypothetical protein